MKTTTGTITATGVGAGVPVIHALGTNGPDVAAIAAVSGTFASAVVQVDTKLQGGSIYYPAAMSDRKTGTKSNGTSTTTDDTPQSWLVDTRGCSHIRVSVLSGTPTDVDVEIVSGQKSDFDGPIQFTTQNYTAASAFGAGITFTGATTANVIGIPDNLADALSISEASTAYLTFVTTDSNEQLLIKKKTSLLDATDLIFGTGLDTAIRWSTGDASDHSLVIALGDTSQMLHITDLGAIASDWALTSPTHPTVCIHSNTTPITDYLLIGGHDGTTANMDVVGGTTLSFKIAGTAYAGVNETGLFSGTYVAAATPGTDQLTLKSTGTAPAGTGANVGHLYADFETDDDELFWLSGAGGTATQLTT